MQHPRLWLFRSASAILALAGVAAVTLQTSSATGQQTPSDAAERAVQVRQMRQAAALIGLTPEALAVSGCNEAQARAVAAALRAEAGALLDRLAQLDPQIAAAGDRLHDLEWRVQTGRATTPQVRERSEAAQAHDTLTQQRGAAIRSSLSRITETLPAVQSTTLARVLRNQGRSLPLQYAATDRDPAAWARLQNALETRRARTRANAGADAYSASVLAAFDADPEVVAAHENLTLRGQQLRAAWEEAVSR